MDGDAPATPRPRSRRGAAHLRRLPRLVRASAVAAAAHRGDAAVLERYRRYLFVRKKRDGSRLSPDDAAGCSPPSAASSVARPRELRALQSGRRPDAAEAGQATAAARAHRSRRSSGAAARRPGQTTRPAGSRDAGDASTPPACDASSSLISLSTTSASTAATVLMREGKGRKDRMLPIGERALPG